MDKFDPNYDVKMKKLIFTEYNKYKLIGGKVV